MSGGLTMSDSHKADQIAFHFHTKLFNVVSHARTTNPSPAKVDKWFNLETPDSELFAKEAREPYRSISLSSLPPPLEIQVLLTIPELTHKQVLVHVSPDSSRVRIDPTPRYVLLEEFVLHFIPSHSPTDVPLPTIYKHGIPLFRSLFTLLRLLPAWKLHKRLRRRVAMGPSLGITLRVRQGPHDDPDVLSLMNTSQAETHTFPSVPHPLGSLALSATYLTHPTFQLDELESLLSSRFLSLDQRPFTPTLAAKNHLRSSSTTRSSPSPPGPSHSHSRSPPRLAISGSHSHSHSHSHSSSGIPLPLPDRGPRLPLPPARLATPSRTSIISSSGLQGPTSSSQPQTTLLSGLSSTRLAHLATGASSSTTTSSSSSLSPTNSFFATGGNTNALITASPEIPGLGLGGGSGNSPLTTRPPHSAPTRPQPQYPFPFKSNTVVGSGSSSNGAIAIIGSSSSSPGAVGHPSSLGSGIPSSLSERLGLGLELLGRERERVVSLPQHSGLGLGMPDPTNRMGLGSKAGVRMHSKGNSASGSISRTPSFRGREGGQTLGVDILGETAGAADGGGSSGTGISAAGAGVPRKRYSSSFGHRYSSPGRGTSPPRGGDNVATGGGGYGSEEREKEKEGGGERESQEREHEKDWRRTSGTITGYQPISHSPLSPHAYPSYGQVQRPPSRFSSPRPSPTSSVFLKTLQGQSGPVDDEEISLFVQDIDRRKPLVGGERDERNQVDPEGGRGQGEEENQEMAVAVAPMHSSPTHHASTQRQPLYPAYSRQPRSSPLSPHIPSSSSSSGSHPSPVLSLHPQPGVGILESPSNVQLGLASATRSSGGNGSLVMLTSEKEVDERLRKMNEVFWGSLEGLGGSGRSRSRDRRGSGSGTVNRGSGSESGESDGRFKPKTRGASSGASGRTPRHGFRRQGSEEVMGKMEMEGGGDGVGGMGGDERTGARGRYFY